MTSRSQRRKAVAELASGEFEVTKPENNQTKNCVAGPITSPKNQRELLDEIKTSLGKEIMSDQILAENQQRC